jgi:hypothetical protein
MDAYQQNLNIQRTLADRDKTNAGAQRELSLSYQNLADVLNRKASSRKRWMPTGKAWRSLNA